MKSIKKKHSKQKCTFQDQGAKTRGKVGEYVCVLLGRGGGGTNASTLLLLVPPSEVICTKKNVWNTLSIIMNLFFLY